MEDVVISMVVLAALGILVVCVIALESSCGSVFGFHHRKSYLNFVP